MGVFLHDLSHAFRGLLRSPGFTATAVLTLALGIGANSAIFSLVDRMMLRPLPLPDPGRLMVVTEYSGRTAAPRDNLSWPDFLDLQREATQFTGLAALRSTGLNLTGDAEPEQVRAGMVTANFFDVLQVQPRAGRGFRAEEGQPGGPRAVVLSDRLWKRRFGADPALVGRTIRVNGDDTLVAGVLAPDFEFPYQLRGVDLFVPMALTPDQRQSRGSHFLGGVGRLKPGATLASARQEVAAIIARLEKAYPESNTNYVAKVVPVQEEVLRKAKPVLWSLLGAVGFVLLIACANVANLLLARSAGRERELAIRAALGADRRRLVAQLLTESLLLGLLGGAAGLLVAQWAAGGLGHILPLRLPPGGSALDGRVLAFTGVLSLATVLVFGAIPALQASRGDLQEGLREGSKGSASPVQQRLRSTLVAVEVALATALLVGSGLMLRSLWKLQHVDPGFDANGVVIASLDLPVRKYPGAAARRAFSEQVVQRLAAAPGVQSAATADIVPLNGMSTTSSYSVEGVPDTDRPNVALHQDVSPGYFRTFGIPILQGRTFQAEDSAVVLVSRQMARRHWPGQDPVGKRISMAGDQGPWLTVIGVAGDVRYESLAEEPAPQFYLPLMDPAATGDRITLLSVLVRGAAGPETLKPVLKAALREADPEMPLTRVRAMDDLLADDRRESRARTLLFSVFAGLALLLAAGGIYGVTSTLVAQRTREIGIRMALGAQVRDVLRLVVGQGFRTIGLGMGAGLVATVALGRLIQSQLMGISPLDPPTYTAVFAVLGAVALAATLLPALRAAKVDPAVALRTE
ncbi:MAG: ABC transporter permease [Holophagaceae bacterium]|nr:ABC transporter permease [Holophagaceae bacterium]